MKSEIDQAKQLINTKLDCIEKEIEISPVNSPLTHYLKGMRQAYRESLRLLGQMNID